MLIMTTQNLDTSFTDLCDFLSWENYRHSVTLEELRMLDDKFKRLNKDFNYYINIAYYSYSFDNIAPLSHMCDTVSLLSDSYKSWAWENYSNLNGINP